MGIVIKILEILRYCLILVCLILFIYPLFIGKANLGDRYKKYLQSGLKALFLIIVISIIIYIKQ